MTVDELRLLTDYGNWANKRLFEALSGLSDEQFTRPLSPGGISIRNVLVHQASAEWGWMERSGGPARGAKLEPADYPDFASVDLLFQNVKRYSSKFFGSLTEAQSATLVDFTLGTGLACTMTVGEMLHHAANHGVHHRGQVALMMQQLDCAAEDFDILLYYMEQRSQAQSDK